MKKQGIFYFGDTETSGGVDRKVAAQLKSLNTPELGCRQIRYANYSRSLFNRLLFRLPFTNVYPRWTYSKEFDRADFVYFRRSHLSVHCLRVMKKIRRRNPKAKILYEIPTYPFKKELTSRWFDYPLWWKEYLCMLRIHRYVDRIVTVSDDEVICGVPTIRMMNGIDLGTVRPIKPAPEDGAIHVVGVASITRWHGYDRFLEGLGEYYRSGGRRNIVLHLVGTGTKKTMGGLRRLVERYRLADRVIFHGYRTGEELDRIYDRCHLGLIALATQDKDIHRHSTLKSREYLAKGLPTVSTGITDVFENRDYKYNLRLPSDTVCVNMQDIVSFYDAVYGTVPRRQVIETIRCFAASTVDVGITMAPVIDYLLSDARR